VNGFGAEITDIDSHLKIDDKTFDQIQKAWFDYSILIFRNLSLSPEEQIKFTSRLGQLHVMVPTDYNLKEFPEIFVVGNDSEAGSPVGLRRAGMGFHTDGEDKLLPNAGSFLHAIQVPPVGGDTLFADLYQAWKAISNDVKNIIKRKKARYSRIDLHHIHYPHLPALTELQKNERPDVFHPLARKHPNSHRTALYIGRWACDIEGLSPSEGMEIIQSLQHLAQEERFIHRHHWVPGDAILWDNRCTQHCATEFEDKKYIRRMHRTTIEGSVPIMAD